MTVTLRLFASARDLCGFSSKQVDLPSPTLDAVVQYLTGCNPAFGDLRKACRFAVNRAYVSEEVMLRDGDEVAVVPPVSGG